MFSEQIKDMLKPMIEQRQQEIIQDFGDVDVFTNNMISCFSSTNTLRDLLVEIEQLYADFTMYTNDALAQDFLCNLLIPFFFKDVCLKSW